MTTKERNWFQTEMYYLAVMDCDDEIENILGDNRHGHIEVKATMTANEDHLPYEKQGMVSVDTFLVAVFVVMLVMNWRSWSSFTEKFDTCNSPHVFCIVAMCFQMAAILLDLQYHVLYARKGEDHILLDIFSTVFGMVSECIMTTLLLFLANGWYTRFQKYDLDEGMEIYAPLMMLIILVHVMFGIFSFLDRDAYHKYHDFHGWVGFGLIAIKFILIGIYFYFYS